MKIILIVNLLKAQERLEDNLILNGNPSLLKDSITESNIELKDWFQASTKLTYISLQTLLC